MLNANLKSNAKHVLGSVCKCWVGMQCWMQVWNAFLNASLKSNAKHVLDHFCKCWAGRGTRARGGGTRARSHGEPAGARNRNQLPSVSKDPLSKAYWGIKGVKLENTCFFAIQV